MCPSPPHLVAAVLVRLRHWSIPARGRTLLRVLLLLMILPIAGMLGFHLIEGWPLFDALYMSMITITTVGFSEIRPLSNAGRTFVIFYLVAGIGIFSFSAARLGEMIVRLELRDLLEKRRMRRSIESLSGHYIICGFGRMGLALARQLSELGLPFVVVDRSETSTEECQRCEWPFITGDATDDRILVSAGIERAKGLAAVLSSDADNVFVVLSARLLAKDVFIIARATDEASVTKLQKAGANRVIPLFETSAFKMAQLLRNPNIEDLADVFRTEGEELELAEVVVDEKSLFLNKPLDFTQWKPQGVFIIGLKKPDGHLIVPVPPATILDINDRLIVLGQAEGINRLTTSI